MGKNDWTAFTKRVTVNAPREEIYRSLATRGGLESWFLRQAEFIGQDNRNRTGGEVIKAGDRYSWLWFGWGDEINEKGEVIETNDYDFIKFTFHDPMVVSIRILTDMVPNVVELVQENIPVDDDSKINYYAGCGEGWTFYLANLKSVLEGGLDLRNKDPMITRVINS